MCWPYQSENGTPGPEEVVQVYGFCIRTLHLLVISVMIIEAMLGVPVKNPITNNLDPSMLKSKNQVTLFVNYSYNSFYDFRSPKIYKVNRELHMSKIWP